MTVVDHLVNLLKYHAHMYYIMDAPEITDSEYDQLYQQLVQLEKQNPELKRPDSPTNLVGFKVDGTPFAPVQHHKPLMSLGNVFNQTELSDFLNTLPKETTVALEFKLDGLAVALTYRNRQLVRAATRGDGIVGEDITANILMIRSVPKILDSQFPIEEFEVHGEVTMSLTVLESLNGVLKSLGKKPFANARNAAAGSLRQKDPTKVKERKLNFNPYGSDERLVRLTDVRTYDCLMEILANNFNTTATHTEVFDVSDIDAINQWYLNAHDLRSKLDFDIDGVVVKVNEYNVRGALGERNREPRWAMAYKFPAGTAITQVEGVDWQIGRTGVLTPVARLKPVSLMGVTVTNCTLHNADEVERLDLCIGDTVTVSRQGDVIPKVINVFTELRPRLQMRVIPPKYCPSCGRAVYRPDGEVFIRCRNDKCPDAMKAKISYLVSRECLDIEGLGDQITAGLVDATFFKQSIFDIFDIENTRKTLLEIGIGDKVTDKIINEISSKRCLRLDRLITSLGIPTVAGVTAKLIANKYRTPENFLEALKLGRLTPSTLSVISEIDGIGPITTREWITGLTETGYDITDSDRVPLINHLIEAIESKRISIEPMPEVQTKLQGNTYVITGSFDISRDIIKEKLIHLGAKVSGTVSANTTAVIAGREAGSKLKKAQSLGIPILNEQQLMDLLQ